jgi:pilus assembly protein Flp/PilA
MQMLSQRNSRRLAKGELLEFRFTFKTLEKENEMTGLMVSMLAFIAGVKDKFESEKGATAVEYGLLVALIAAVIIGTVVTLGGQINTAFTKITAQL